MIEENGQINFSIIYHGSDGLDSTITSRWEGGRIIAISFDLCHNAREDVLDIKNLSSSPIGTIFNIQQFTLRVLQQNLNRECVIASRYETAEDKLYYHKTLQIPNLDTRLKIE